MFMFTFLGQKILGLAIRAFYFSCFVFIAPDVLVETRSDNTRR